jgi:hypothetical protein
MQAAISGDSPEAVAYKLALEVREIEDKFANTGGNYNRAEFLDLYAECLAAVRGDRKIK